MRYVHAGIMLLGAAIYLVIFEFIFREGLTNYSIDPLLLTAAVWNAIMVGLAIAVAVDSILKVRRGRTDRLVGDVFVVKLASIPFFVLNFALWALFGAAGLGILIFGGGILTTAALISVGPTYLAMLSTSVPGWASIIQLRREGRIDTAQTVGYAILLLVFIADIVAGILLFARARRTRHAIAAPEPTR
jgi:hypothetical protein